MSKTPLIERLLAKIDQRGPDECWPWTGSVDGKGYGRIAKNGRDVRVHRKVYELSRNAILVSAFVRPTCDNPLCCNPRHLISGIHQDNMDDMVARGRCRNGVQRGERNGRARLTEAQARAILADPRIYRVIAREYGVSRSTVGALKCGQNWKHARKETE
jgi:hypothetical protein